MAAVAPASLDGAAALALAVAPPSLDGAAALALAVAPTSLDGAAFFALAVAPPSLDGAVYIMYIYIYIGMMEDKMETTIMGYLGIIGTILWII